MLLGAAWALSLASCALIYGARSQPLLANVGFALLGFVLTLRLIPSLGPSFLKRGFVGKDLSKKHQPLLPETMGAVSAMVYLFIMLFFLPFAFYKYVVLASSGGGNREEAHREISHVHTGRMLHQFPHEKLGEYLSAILSLQSMVILGVADDLFDIRWRHKLLLPAFAVIPMLILYFIDFGVTQVVVPIPLRPHLGRLVDIGPLYYVYMGAVAIFCPNAINILAGVNGLEVGQSLVIALFIVWNDCLYLFKPNHPALDSHLFSIYFMLPFLGVSLALLYHNWYPANVFVGDTYCYFAGMVFVVVGILGHFSKTLLLFFIPQIINFIYSAPQLFHLVPCPRHRLPKLRSDGMLDPSRADLTKGVPAGTIMGLKVLEQLRLIKLWRNEKGDIVECSNFTIINLTLVWFGPLREDRLSLTLLVFQAICCTFGLLMRHQMALLIFTEDN